MADLPRTSIEMPPSLDEPDLAAIAGTGIDLSPTPLHYAETSETVQVIGERLSVGKRRRSTGSVLVGVRTEVVDAVAEVELDRYRVEVTRVPVGQVVDAMPVARTEGGLTIVPVLEERFVVVKQLFLVEEVHIRHVIERETTREPVKLRRQRAVVERLDANGQPGPPGETSTD